MLNLLVVATALAGALLPWALPSGERVDPVLLSILAGLAAVSGLRCVKAAGRATWFVPIDAFVLAGIVVVGGRGACALALAGLMGSTAGTIKKFAARRALFNVGAVLVATVAAAATFLAVPYQAAAFAAAAASFFLVNTGLVAAAVALDRSTSWVGVWKKTFLPSVPRFALAALLGAGLAVLGTVTF